MNWFVRSFGARYRQLYAHRDEAEAERALALLAPASGWPGRRVLDLACGAGRYCRALRREGAVPVGVDLSPTLVAEASLSDPGAPYLRADMRQIPLRDGAVQDSLSMFTSFGYFESVGEHAVLAAEMARVSSRRVVIDIPNPAALESNLVPNSEREVDGLLVRETRWLDSAARRVCKRMELLGSDGLVVEEYEEHVMLFELDQLREFFEPHGLTLKQCLGSYSGEEFRREGSARQLCVFARGER